MTTPTNTPDPALPPIPEALVRVEGMPRYMAGELRDYGRACHATGYAQARADLIAELRPVAVCLETSQGLHHAFAPVGLAPDTKRTARRLNQRFCRLAIIPKE